MRGDCFFHDFFWKLLLPLLYREQRKPVQVHHASCFIFPTIIPPLSFAIFYLPSRRNFAESFFLLLLPSFYYSETRYIRPQRQQLVSNNIQYSLTFFGNSFFFRYFKTFQAPIGIRQEREAVFWNCYRHFREKEEEGRRKKSPGPGKMYIKPNAASAAAAKHTAIRENEMRTAISCTKAQRQGLLLDLGNPTRSWPCRGKYCGPTCTYVSRNGTNHRQYLIQVLYFDDEGLKYILFKPRNDGKAHGAFEDLSKRI